jgi:hypothetical protein
MVLQREVVNRADPTLRSANENMAPTKGYYSPYLINNISNISPSLDSEGAFDSLILGLIARGGP